MRKISILSIAVALTALTACQKEAQPQSDARSLAPAVLHASFEAPATTRAGFDYDAADKSYSHFWETGDCIAFFPKEDRPDRYKCTDPEAGTFELDWKSKLSHKRADYSHNYAIYPSDYPIGIMFNNYVEYDEELVELMEMEYGMGYPITTTNPPVLQIVVPGSETYAEGDGTFGYGNIMVARSTDDQLKFKSVMGWLKLQLTGAAPLQKIRVTADQTAGSIALQGAGRIQFASDGTPSLVMETECEAAKPWKEYRFGSNVVVLDPVNPTSVYLALPPTVFAHGFTVKVTYTDNSTTEFSTTRSITIQRNHVTPMAVREGKSINATLVTGSTFNGKLKTLANGGTTVAYSTQETRVKGISVQKGSDVTSDCVVSSEGSENPVYAVFDSETGVVTLHTPAYRIFLPANADNFCSRMAGLASIDWDELDGSAVTSAYNLFNTCSALQEIGDIILPEATKFNVAFYECQNLERIGRVSLPKATNLYQAFYRCKKLTSFGDIDFPKATNVGYLFFQCSQLSSIGSVSLPLVTIANGLFSGCAALTGVGDVILPEATNASSLFSGCSELASIGTLSMPKVTDVSYLFYGCSALTSFGDVSFNLATDATYLFRNCSSLTTIGNINLPQATNASYLLSGCKALTSVGNINLPKATNVSYLMGTDMSASAYGICLLTSDHLGTITAPLAKNVSRMFRNCTGLTTIPLVIGTDFTDMSYMFAGCTSLTSLGSLTLSSTTVTNLEHMFDGCTNLTSVDISGLAGTVTGVAGMFYNCSQLGNVTLNAGLNTASVTDMSGMFYHCSTMTAIDVSGFSTANVTNMKEMFRGCSGITSLNLSGFNTAKVVDTEYMFDGCSALTTLGSGAKFTCTALERCSYMFCNCSHLGNVDISEMKGTLKASTTYSSPSLTKMFYNCSSMTTIRFNAALYTDGVYSYESIFEGCSSLTQLYVKGFYLGKWGSSDNTAVRFSRTMTNVKTGCVIHYSSVPSMGTHASSYDMPSMFAFYSSPSSSSFTWTTTN